MPIYVTKMLIFDGKPVNHKICQIAIRRPVRVYTVGDLPRRSCDGSSTVYLTLFLGPPMSWPACLRDYLIRPKYVSNYVPNMILNLNQLWYLILRHA